MSKKYFLSYLFLGAIIAITVVTPPKIFACSVKSDGSGDSCPKGQTCKNTTICTLDPAGGTTLRLCTNGTCVANQPAPQQPQQPAQQQPAQQPANTGSHATCNVNSDGSGDSCTKSHPGEVCTNTTNCVLSPNGGIGSDGSALKLCVGTCTLKSSIPPPAAPKAGDKCSRNVLDPIGTCGGSLTCVATNCTGDNLNQICQGTCKDRPDNDGSCTYVPSKGNQGNCKDGSLCKASANCSSLYCTGTCVPAPSLEPTEAKPPSPPCLQNAWVDGQCQSMVTAFGDLQTDPAAFTTRVFAILLSFSGGIALLLIIRAGYLMLTSQGKPEQVQAGRDQLIAAIVGLAFLIFSMVLLQVIGFDILHVPGFDTTSGAGGTCKTNADCSGGMSCNFNGTIGKCQ